MKTFSLRLTENEAEALEAIAFFKGVSKNKALEKMIACEYAKIDADAVHNEEILYCLAPEDLAAGTGKEALLHAETREDLIAAIKYFDYGIEKYAGIGEPTKEDLIEEKEAAITSLITPHYFANLDLTSE